MTLVKSLQYYKSLNAIVFYVIGVTGLYPLSTQAIQTHDLQIGVRGTLTVSTPLHLGSRIQIPDLGVKKAPDPGSRILDPDPQLSY
jgi:hypothetical protein